MRTAAQVLLGLGFGAVAVSALGLIVDLLGDASNPYAGFIPVGIMLIVAGTWVRIVGPAIPPGETVRALRRRSRRKDAE